MVPTGSYGYMCDDWVLNYQYSWILGMFIIPLVLTFFFCFGKYWRNEWSGKPLLWSFIANLIGWPVLQHLITHGLLLKKLPQGGLPPTWFSGESIVGIVVGIVLLLALIFSFVFYCIWASSKE